MARGGRTERTTQFVRVLVLSIFEQQLSDSGRVPEAQSVLDALATDKQRRDWPDVLPGLRKVQELLKGPRQRAKEEQEVDKPWSLGAAHSEIPDDATGALLRVLRFALVLGFRFSVRHAIWAARLRWVDRAGGDAVTGEVRSPGILYGEALAYARRERVGDLTGQPLLDTRDLDARLATDSEVLALLQAAARVSPIASPGPDVEEGAMSLDSHVAWIYLEASRPTLNWLTVPEFRREAADDLFFYWANELMALRGSRSLNIDEHEALFDDLARAIEAHEVEVARFGPIPLQLPQTVWIPPTALLEQASNPDSDQGGSS